MVVIGQTRFWSEGNLFEWEGGQTHLPEQIKHELADSSGSQVTNKQHKQLILVFVKKHTEIIYLPRQ